MSACARFFRITFFVLPVLVSSAALADPLVLSVTSAEPFVDYAGEPAISFDMTEESAAAFEALTETAVGKTMELRLDGVTVMAPVVREPIRGGRGVISGNLAMDEAANLARRIASGAVKVEVEVVDPYEGLPVLPSMK